MIMLSTATRPRASTMLFAKLPLVLLFLLPATALAATNPPRHVLWDATEDTIPAEWTRGIRAAPTDAVTFHVPLRGANVGVEEALSRVSDPLSPHYGEYLTPEQLRDQFAAPVAV